MFFVSYPTRDHSSIKHRDENKPDLKIQIFSEPMDEFLEILKVGDQQFALLLWSAFSHNTGLGYKSAGEDGPPLYF